MKDKNKFPTYNFPTDYKSILVRLESVNPKKYGRTRNFIDGDVSYLSPYISRGVLSTKQVAEFVLSKGFEPKEIQKFLQELAWRDYWQQIWLAKGTDINEDLRSAQKPVSNHEFPVSVLQFKTGIEAVDEAIEQLYKTGYMHNHVRMYVAAIVCNMAYSHWKLPAKWLYYHLLDGDWASNALSWQWVAGSNANKKYVANQNNINKYCHTNQQNTFLNVDYSAFNNWEVPDSLKQTKNLNLTTELPATATEFSIKSSLPTYIYNWYNLDPNWAKDVQANRILLLEPSVFEQFPISEHSIQFMLDLSKNIPGIQIFNGEFAELKALVTKKEFHFKEHPFNNYEGVKHSRDWISSVTGYFSSFFKFWKKVKKEKGW